MRKLLGILDYGVGNVASLKAVLQKLGFRVVVGSSEQSLSKVDALFLPGVGSFDFAMKNLRSSKMDIFLSNRFAAQDLNVIGICLGMQILFERSEEGDFAGLGLFTGSVKRFLDRECHVGWNLANPSSDFFGIGRAAFYFNHSYYVDCDPDVIVASSNYQHTFPVVVSKNSFFGVQFHPEKSQDSGLHLLHALVGAD